MRQALTVSIPKALKEELDRVSAQEGVSRSDIVRESLRDFLFVRRYRTLRARMMAKAKKHGIFSDQDVFDRVS
jgi:metal-responsive CopG/Arc/MetJ family transcriptional regulator